MSDKLDLAIGEIRAEISRQDAMWPGQRHTPLEWAAILGEEFGEACRGANEYDIDTFAQELVHVAAVAVQAIAQCRVGRAACSEPVATQQRWLDTLPTVPGRYVIHSPGALPPSVEFVVRSVVPGVHGTLAAFQPRAVFGSPMEPLTSKEFAGRRWLLIPEPGVPIP